MGREEFELLKATVFYHGTTLRLWMDAEAGDGGLFVTKSLHDALTYAEEAATGEAVRNGEAAVDLVVEAVVVLVPGAVLAEMLEESPGRLSLAPDWGWVDAFGKGDGDLPHWTDSLEACGGIHVAGFEHGDKQRFAAVGTEELEGGLSEDIGARP